MRPPRNTASSPRRKRAPGFDTKPVRVYGIHMAGEVQPLTRQTLGRRIADVLRREILFGELTPENPLTQETICARFGTSRIPVRDALQVLTHEGLIESTPSGMRVVALTHRDLEDMYCVEGSLHALATRLATLRASDSALLTLSNINVTMSAAHRAGDQEAVAQANYRFHREINHLAESGRLITVLRSASTKIHGNFLVRFPEDTEPSISDHDAIIAAMRSRDPELASALMFDHVLRSVATLNKASQTLSAVSDASLPPEELEDGLHTTTWLFR